jgi:hypothetical protein
LFRYLPHFEVNQHVAAALGPLEDALAPPEPLDPLAP